MECEKLESLFVINSTMAINESKRIIASSSGFNNFQDFENYHTNNAHFSYCPKPYSSDYMFELSVFCLDCAINNNDLGFICLPCFINGNHEGHNYFVFPGLIGQCDCGDKNHIKSTGFCSKHQACDDDNLENYLDEQLRKNLTEVVFKAAISALLSFNPNDYQKSAETTAFLTNLFNLGDGFRRLFVKTIIEQFDFPSLINNIPEYGDILNLPLTNLFSYLLHDQLFMRHFSRAVYTVISERILKDSSSCMVKSYPEISYDCWFSFFFQCFSEPVCRYNIEKNEWNWVSFCIEILKYFKDLLAFIKNQKYQSYPLSFSIIKNFHFLTSIQPNEQTQEFFDKIVTEVFNSGTHENTKSETNDTIIVISFKKFDLSYNFKSFYDYLSLFHNIFYCFESKPNLKIDKLIDELDNKIDISPIFMINKNYVGNESGKKNENDKLISHLIEKKDQSKEKMSFFDKFKTTMKNLFQSYPSKFYKSIFNGGSYFLAYPLYDVFNMVFNTDYSYRIKLAQFLSLEKYQPLRIKLGIISMKKIVSSIYYDLSISKIYNSQLSDIYDKIYSMRKVIRLGLTPFPHLQLLIGLHCNDKNEFILKEFFAFELAREFGLFERINSEKYQKIVFGFLYVALLLVIDRTLFHDADGYNVTKEQIIFALKKGVHSIDQLNGMCDRNEKPGKYFTVFNEILMEVATKNTVNQEDESNGENESNITLSQLKNDNAGNDNYNENEDEDDNDDDEDEDDKNYKENVERNNNNSSSSNANIRNDVSNHKKESQNSYIKPVNFYLKDGIECNMISSVIPVDLQKSFMNIEVSKNQDKLLKIQSFEPEETYFFKSDNNEDSSNNNNDNNSTDNGNENDNNNNNNDDDDAVTNTNISQAGLKINLKQFLLTPTILAAIYHSMRYYEIYHLQQVTLNDHLAMNILILASRFIKERAEANPSKANTKALNEQDTITYNSLSDFVLKIKHLLFNYSVEGKGDDEKVTIEDSLTPELFASFLKMKVSLTKPLELPPKSLIDVLIEKGPIGQEALKQISLNIHIEDLASNEEKENNDEDEKNQIKTIQKRKAAKLKEDIMNKYTNIRNNYQFSDSIVDSLTLSSAEILSPNKKVCSLCSESKKKEILSYPLYIYRTKLPFIFDKPPLFDNSVEGISVDDNENDIEKDDDFVNMVKDEMQVDGLLQSEEENLSIENFKNTINEIYEQQKKEKVDLKIGKEKMKRITVGANFVVQFGICPHPVHKSCVNNDDFVCPIDRSTKNGFLPCLDEIQRTKVFKNIETFELNSDSDSLTSNIIDSINSFIDKFRSFFDDADSIDVFVELIKSISGLIETYEIRVRNLPNSLDSTKTRILSRNLFLTVWYAYRIQKKPKLSDEVDTKLTEFQKFVKLLIENDQIFDEKGNNKCNDDEIKKIISSLLSSSFSDDKNVKRKEKMICLFLKRVCLAEFFLLNENLSNDENELIDWDEILATENLSKRYEIEFTSIDLSKGEEFEFKPFIFAQLPNEFLKLAQSPYKLPIQNIGQISLFNLLDYNYMIKHFDDFDDVQDEEDKEGNESNDDENNKNGNDGADTCSNLSDEEKKNQRGIQLCDADFLPYLMTFYGKRRYPSVFMFTGAISPQIFLVDQSYGAALDTFYVDRYGCPDVNHLRFQPLFLNEERYEKLIDQILSGDFSYNLRNLDKLREDDDDDFE